MGGQSAVPTESSGSPGLAGGAAGEAFAEELAQSPFSAGAVIEADEGVAVLSAEALAEALSVVPAGTIDGSPAASLRSFFAGWSERQLTAASGRLLGASQELSSALAQRLCGSEVSEGIVAQQLPEESLSRELRYFSSGEGGDVLKARDSLVAKSAQPSGLGPGSRALLAACDVQLGEKVPEAPAAAVADFVPQPSQLGSAAALSVAVFADTCRKAARSRGGGGDAQAALAAERWSAVATSFALLSLARTSTGRPGGDGTARPAQRADDEKQLASLALDLIRTNGQIAVSVFRARRGAEDGGGGGSAGGAPSSARALLAEAADQSRFGSGGAGAADPAKARWAQAKQRGGEAAEAVTAVDELLSLIGLTKVKEEFLNLYERVQLAKEQGKPPLSNANARFEGCGSRSHHAPDFILQRDHCCVVRKVQEKCSVLSVLPQLSVSSQQCGDG